MDATPSVSLLRDLISSYNELNAATVEELDGEPSPLEFMRFVARNTPFVVRGAAADWKALRRWDARFLAATLGDRKVSVAVTPSGYADAPTQAPPPHHGMVFATPHEETQSFSEFLDFVTHQERDPEWAGGLGEVRYAQTQNDNLRDEYLPLFADVQRDIPFARIALQKEPDAINVWMGNSRSVTALHRDNYENIYVQVLGRKHFVLLSPLCQPCVGEQALRRAKYVRRRGGGGGLDLCMQEEEEEEEEGRGVGGGDGEEQGQGHRRAAVVPFALWDPDDTPHHDDDDDDDHHHHHHHHFADSTAHYYSDLARPVRVTLEPGDMLYLPAMWYHKVSQSCSSPEEGLVVAVNYWYDMEFGGPLYPLCSLVRDLTLDMREKKDNRMSPAPPSEGKRS